MKILFPIGAFYPSRIGGPCNTLYWHTCALAQNNIEVTTVTTTIGINKGEVVTNEMSNLPCGSVYYGDENSLKTLRKALGELHKHDIIHLNSLFHFFSIISFFYTKLFLKDKKVIWSVRGELDPGALVFSSLKKKPIIFLYKKFIGNVLFHSTSDSETISIKKMFPKNRVVQIPNLIEPAPRLNLPQKKQLLYMGRIHPIKGLHKLIDSLALSNVFMQSGFKLQIVGKHEKRHAFYKDELFALVKKLKLEEKVIFAGYMESEDKERTYSQSHALILPSETENFGNVVVEALNQGTPVIASKGTPWEILEEYGAGYHVNNEPEDLALAINKLLQLDEKKYAEMRVNCINLMDEKFNINTQIHNWINIYKDLKNEK